MQNQKGSVLFALLITVTIIAILFTLFYGSKDDKANLQKTNQNARDDLRKSNQELQDYQNQLNQQSQ
ncbi:MAG: hypothetical protein AAB410_02655 [Patescibacteria group bacterium]